MRLRFVLVPLVLASRAFAAPPPKPPPAPNSVLPMGRSVGSPTQGKLVGGAHLEETPYLRIVPAYSLGDVRWGLGSLVGMLDRAARVVRHQFSDAKLSIGHMSRMGGGDLDRHASHESGRDADVAFYVKDARGKPLYADHLVAFGGDGGARTWPGATFDDQRNWLLIASLLNDPMAHVSHIFISAPLRARLLAFAARIGAPAALQTRAAVTMAQPVGSLPHDDHFHVRISCPPTMPGCIENPTIARRFNPVKKKPVLAPAPQNKPVQTQKDQPQKHIREDTDVLPAASVDALDGT